MPAKHHVKLRRPSLPPILEIDEDGLPIFEMSIHEGRRWSGEDGEGASVRLSEWPTEFDD